MFEIVLNQVTFCFGLGVLVEAASDAGFVGIDYCVPGSIEADRGTAAHISDCSWRPAFSMYADSSQQHRGQQRSPHLASSKPRARADEYNEISIHGTGRKRVEKMGVSIPASSRVPSSRVEYF